MNRRKLLSLLGMSPVLLAGPGAEARDKAAKTPSGPAKLTGVNPKGMAPAVQLVPMAPRLTSLDGKTIFLVSDGFPGADHFLAQMGDWFKKNMPSVTTEYRLKSGQFADDDPKLNAEIKAKGNAVIMAIGH
jgi:hypothetical protein